MARAFGRLNSKSCVLLICDMQEKFRNTVSFFPDIAKTCKRMLDASDVIKLPVIATEQYPKGLGPTIAELGLAARGVTPVSKTCFSMVTKEVEQKLVQIQETKKSVLLCGIEAHACIFQTAIDLLDRQYHVHLVVDGISSRRNIDRLVAFRRLEKAGAFLTTSECALLALVKDASDPSFKEIQKLLMDQAPDQGLQHL